jgi:hypothetical protein
MITASFQGDSFFPLTPALLLKERSAEIRVSGNMEVVRNKSKGVFFSYGKTLGPMADGIYIECKA